MSSKNTPNSSKPSKSIGTLYPSRKVTSSASSKTPLRSTLDSMRKTSSTASTSKSVLIKQNSSDDLRDRLKLNNDFLNTAFASSPSILRSAKLQPKSKSTTTINSFYTPTSLYKGFSTASSTPDAMQILPSTPKSISKRLFGSSTVSLNEAVTKTPECFSKVTLETSRSSQKLSTDQAESKNKENGEISNLTVAVRVRPMNTKECTTPSAFNVITIDGNEVTVLAGTNADSSAGLSHSFHYDHAFWSCNTNHVNYADQEIVFKNTTMPLIDKAFEGYNACLFAYGQTGSGKSYSMMGIDSDDDVIKPNSESGIIPRFCYELFRRIEQLKGKITAEIEVSYFEIYNEKIHDLLTVTPSIVGNQLSTPGNQAKRQALRVREHPTWGPYVVDLNTHPVDSHAALKNWLAVGNSQRATAATGMNDKSSRSHSIFNIILNLSEVCDDPLQNGQRKKQQTKRSKISLVDLAGSERVSHTCASGDRLKEGVSINKSLLTLGKVIAALADTKKTFGSFVPYRESVLTWLLRESLGGNSRTVMLATISPANLHLEETLATLRYACQARSIVNRVKVNEDPNDRQIRELRAEIERLQALQQDYERQKIHAVQGPPRKIIIETIDGTDENEKELLRHRLRETEQELIKAQKSWRERLKEAENLRKTEMKLLQQNGLALELSVAQKQPCLVNLAADPMLSGTLLYILPPGIVRIGRPKPVTHVQSDIVLDGPLVGLNHCQIENKRGKLFIQPDNDECETYVNGELITAERQIYHGDRVVIGGSHYFRVSNPECPNRSKSTAVDFQLAHEEILKQQEKRLRAELQAEKEAALLQIEEQRAKHERSYSERVAKLELEQFRIKCDQELMETEKAILAKNRLNESIFEYKPYESKLHDKIKQIMERPTEEGLHETQLKVREATQRCRDIGLNYEFVQTQVADQFGLFKAVVNIIDRANNRMAEWPTARLNVWLDIIRENEVNAENVFDSVDIEWTEYEAGESDLNESLNSSRISLNLSAMREALLGKPTRSCMKKFQNTLTSWTENKEESPNKKSPSSQNTKTSMMKKSLNNDSNRSSIQNTKKKLTYDNDVEIIDEFFDCNPKPKNSSKNYIDDGNESDIISSSERTFEEESQMQLRELRKATLKLKKLFYQHSNENLDSKHQVTANKAMGTIEQIESLTNELRRVLKDEGNEANNKTPKSVRFFLD